MLFNLNKVKLEPITLFSLPLFVVNPLVSLVLLFSLSFLRKPAKSNYYIIFSLVSLYLGFINSTKIPESDLITYKYQFLDAGTEPFIKYIFSYGKEPVFYAINYLVYHLTSGNFELYLIFLTFISYQFLFVSIYIYYRKIGSSDNLILFSIALAALFPELFSLSAHLLRQFLATSLLIYYIVNLIFLKKNYWPILIISIFTHTTVLFFVPFIFIPYFKAKIKLRHFLGLLPVFVLLKLFFNRIVSVAATSPELPQFIRYGFERADTKTIANLGELPAIAYLMVIVLFLISLYFIYIYKNTNDQIVQFLNIFLILMVFVLFNSGNSEICVRYFFFIYFFFPFIFTLPFRFNRPEYRLTRYPIMIGLLFLFFNQISNGVWVYAPLYQLMTNNAFLYF